MSETQRSWVREPLLHFVLLGAALFALDAVVRDRDVEAGEGEIVVSAGRVDNLMALFVKTWQRAPTPAELRGLVHDHVLEEALYREGMALGLDRDDTVIRRRLRQKMEFVVDDVAELAEPTEEDLAKFLAENSAAYAEPARVSFRQVYLSPDKRGAALMSDAAALLGELSEGAVEDPSLAGDATLLDHANGDLRLDDAGRSFGKEFADRLATLAVGQWAGPVESAYGLHLVIVDEREPGRAPELEEVRSEVERDWGFARREEAKQAFNEALLERYRIRIEWPEDLAEAGAAEVMQE